MKPPGGNAAARKQNMCPLRMGGKEALRMVHPDGGLHTQWLSSRKNSLLRCIERLCAETASDCRRTQRRLQEVEEAMATQNQPGSILPGRTMQTTVPVSGGQSALSEVEVLRRRLEAANAEIRRYETRLFAYERAMLDLRRENAELQALCEQARAGETLPEPTPQPTVPVLEKPELPVIHFPAPARDAGVAQGPLPGEIETLLDTGTPEWEPKTKLDHLSVDIISQLEQLMGT